MDTSHPTKQESGFTTRVASNQDPEDPNYGEESDTLAIPPQYRGTAADRKDMSVLGKEQVLRLQRNFEFLPMLGFASTVIVSWEVLLPVFTFVLVNGGTALLFWGFIAVAIGMLLVYLSIAEMASM
ncbi:hypothetical protein H2200_007546 [Cladophialophora chaetospira]|uniref:Uncharacterized protein n=1 Tax=Cladophialophora chaetospira TaxID=386627 RepID=A0AA38X8L2_9EURO|nr:hypothetical protein H2200_007546 [Cladophialophora chaetospira]